MIGRTAKTLRSPNVKAPLYPFTLAVSLLAGCAPYGNEPFRTQELASCTAEVCDNQAIIEHYRDYDLAFVEFTERGNVFDRENMKAVLDRVDAHARYDRANPTSGVTAVVFVHGWKHNARFDDDNVKSFRRLLHNVSKLPRGPRRLVGVYVGWRGLSVDLPGVKELSYWDRKAVAQQVGKGGVTELLLRLESAVIDDERPNRNIFLVTAHSFGGAIVLSALNEVLLERVANAKTASSSRGDCLVTRPFGHGVVLLNPAIEANEALQLKELAAEMAAKTPFCDSQDRLMHVISSYADAATDKAFRWGQRLGVNLTWRQATLPRILSGKNLRFEESELDTTTVGNFVPFQTGRLERLSEHQWKYHSCIEQEKDCVCYENDDAPCEASIREHIRVSHNEPLAFIRSDRKKVESEDDKFIADHNDVFNPAVSAYLASIVAEARYKRGLERRIAEPADEVPANCRGGTNGFLFGPCFDQYLCLFKAVTEETDPSECEAADGRMSDNPTHRAVRGS